MIFESSLLWYRRTQIMGLARAADYVPGSRCCRMTLSSLAFNLGVVSAILAIVDLSESALSIIYFEDTWQDFLAGKTTSFSYYNELTNFFYGMQGAFSCFQFVGCTILIYKSLSDHLQWFTAWMIVFSSFFVLYLRVIFGVSLFQMPIVDIMVRGIMDSVLNVYIVLVCFCTYPQHIKDEMKFTWRRNNLDLKGERLLIQSGIFTV
ncbi:uncharacterized protein [Periplaneta americana]|uniref:uncharacterized protein n=1 Tax=Periplaneta americana TaxID=6978 RepID=UPI0037E9428D